MCTFCSDLPSTEYGANRKKAPITLFLKPNDANNEKEKYRFRILNFRSQGKNDRRHPFISRFVHNHWGMNDNGFKVVDDYVVCPSSAYIDAKNDPTLGFMDTYKELKLKEKKPTWDNVCPVCRRLAEAWNAYNSSGRTDRLSLERIKSLKKQFQGIVPVYVINDPVNEKNNGRFKCIIFSNQDEYKQFVGLVNAEIAKISVSGTPYGWCNGKNAVDFYLRMEKVPVIWNAGKANEKQGWERKITKMAFGKEPYDLLDANKREIVTKEAIDRFEFDDQFYVKSTKDELEEFYKKYYSLMSSNIPTDEDDVFDSSSSTSQPQQKVQIPTNPSAQAKDENTSKIVNDLMSDPEDLPVESNSEDDDFDEDEGKLDTSSKSISDLLKEMDFKD